MTIAQVSAEYNLSADTLRYYERVGLIPKVNRNAAGVRNYTEEDCRWVKFAKCMRSAGLPVEVLTQYVQLFLQGSSTQARRKEILCQQRDCLQAKIQDMQAALDRLDLKIEQYESRILPLEQEMLG